MDSPSLPPTPWLGKLPDSDNIYKVNSFCLVVRRAIAFASVKKDIHLSVKHKCIWQWWWRWTAMKLAEAWRVSLLKLYYLQNLKMANNYWKWIFNNRGNMKQNGLLDKGILPMSPFFKLLNPHSSSFLIPTQSGLIRSSPVCLLWLTTMTADPWKRNSHFQWV